MKRIVLIAALLLGGMAAAQADNDIYNNTRKVERSDFELHADTAACDQEYGAPQNGTVHVARLQAVHAGARLAVRSHGAGKAGSDLDRSGNRLDLPRPQDGRHRDRLVVLEFLDGEVGSLQRGVGEGSLVALAAGDGKGDLLDQPKRDFRRGNLRNAIGQAVVGLRHHVQLFGAVVSHRSPASNPAAQ